MNSLIRIRMLVALLAVICAVQKIGRASCRERV